MIEILKQPPLEYNEYYKCLNILRMGIWATKFSYNDKKYRVVYLRLGKDGQSLSYKTKLNQKTCYHMLFGPSILHFENIASFSYGGSTMTFQRHKRSVQKRLKKQRHKKLQENQTV